MEGSKQSVTIFLMILILAFIAFIGSTQAQLICCYRDPFVVGALESYVEIDCSPKHK